MNALIAAPANCRDVIDGCMRSSARIYAGVFCLKRFAHGFADPATSIHIERLRKKLLFNCTRLEKVPALPRRRLAATSELDDTPMTSAASFFLQQDHDPLRHCCRLPAAVNKKSGAHLSMRAALIERCSNE